MKILPHRYPFLLVDRVLEFESGVRAVAVKSVTVNEPFFPGHFPELPIMPGVLQVEALAQVGGIAMLHKYAPNGDRDFFFGGVDKVKWRKPVVPGDTLVLEMNLTSFREKFGIAKMEGKYVFNIDLFDWRDCRAHLVDLLLTIDVFLFFSLLRLKLGDM